MQYDILYLEDDLQVHQYGMDLCAYHGLNVIGFLSGVKALEYVQMESTSLPLAYLCDMQIKGDERELASPLNLFLFLKQRRRLELFCFYTGHISEHDKKVLAFTGIPIIVKSSLRELHEFLERVREKKLSP